MTGPIPNPYTGLMDNSADMLDQLNALAVYLKEHDSVSFKLQYVSATGLWTGLFVDYSDQCKTYIHLGRFPTEVIYRLLEEVTA